MPQANQPILHDNRILHAHRRPRQPADGLGKHSSRSCECTSRRDSFIHPMRKNSKPRSHEATKRFSDAMEPLRVFVPSRFPNSSVRHTHADDRRKLKNGWLFGRRCTLRWVARIAPRALCDRFLLDNGTAGSLFGLIAPALLVVLLVTLGAGYAFHHRRPATIRITPSGDFAIALAGYWPGHHSPRAWLRSSFLY